MPMLLEAPHAPLIPGSWSAPTPTRALVVALLAVLAATALRWSLTPVLGPTQLRYVTYFAAIVLAAAYGGYLPGLIALVCSIVLASVLFPLRSGPAEWGPVSDLAALLVFAVFGGLSVVIGAALHRMRARAEANAALARAHADEAYAHSRQAAADVEALKAEMGRREQAEAATRRLRLHLAHSPLAVIEWDGDLRVTRWEGEAERMFGYSAGEVVGRALTDMGLVHPEDAPQVAAVSARLAHDLEPVVVSRNRNLHRDGRVLHCEWYNSVARGPDGRIGSILSLVLDVTQARQREAEREELVANLAAERARLRAVMEQMPAAVLLHEAPSGRLLLQNPEAERFMVELALPSLDLTEAPLPFRRIDGTDYPPQDFPVRRALREGTTTRGERMVCTLITGEARVLSVSAGPVRDGAGRIIAAIMSFVDVTAEHAHLAMLEQTDRRYRAVTEATPGLVWMTDTSGWATYVNPAWMSYTGCSLADLHARGWESFHHPQELPRIRDDWAAAVAGTRPYEAEFRYLRHDGTYCWFLARAVPMLDAKGGITGWAGMAIEVHDRRSREHAGGMVVASEGVPPPN